MKLLITGASGFVANQIIPYLREAGVELVLVSRDAESLKSLHPECVSGDYSSWTQLANGVDAVLHLAAKDNDSKGDEEQFLAASKEALQTVLENTKAASIPRVILTSSLDAGSDSTGIGFCGASKKAAEKLLQSEPGLSVRVMQLAAVHGANFADNLSAVTRFPKRLQPIILDLIGAFRPTLRAERLANEILRALGAASSERKILTNEQKDNQTFAAFKRTIDLFFVAAVGFFLWWLLLIVWLAVKLTSAGPGIFAQERTGKHGRSFICYKFRTMRQGTKQVGTHALSAASLTPIGAILRKTKIDELPQIVNILKGEMSLIGPRPCLPSQKELVEIRKESGVLNVLPGISGMSQVRNIDMSDPAKLSRSDAEYIALRTIPLELKIIFATLTGGGQGDKVRQK